METNIKTVIEMYLLGILSDEFHRYKSWDNCFQAFSGRMLIRQEIHTDSAATSAHILEVSKFNYQICGKHVIPASIVLV